MRPSARAVKRYPEKQDFQSSKDRPYLHFADGGVANNLGMRGALEALEAVGASATFRGEVGFGAIRRIAVIVAHSRSAPKTDGTARRARAARLTYGQEPAEHPSTATRSRPSSS